VATGAMSALPVRDDLNTSDVVTILSPQGRFTSNLIALGKRVWLFEAISGPYQRPYALSTQKKIQKKKIKNHTANIPQRAVNIVNRYSRHYALLSIS